MDQGKNISHIKSGWIKKGDKYLFMRSGWELNYSHYLNEMIKRGRITDWEYEVDTFWFDKIKRGTTSYKPDFKVYLPDGTIEYHEIKGYMDAKSKTKLNRMRIYHPDIKIKLIASKEYKAIEKFAAVIPNWGRWIRKNPNNK